MGPITLFDKSFLQSLSLDESVWFDHFFLINVCPLFYVETLADLDKPVGRGRSPEHEVAIIADKFPEMHGSPSLHHVDLCVRDLLGQTVPMTGQMVLGGGRPVSRGVVFERSPEAEAFGRWQKGEFEQIEHVYAQTWRRGLASISASHLLDGTDVGDLNTGRLRTLEEAKALAENVVSRADRTKLALRLAVKFLNVPSHMRREIARRWRLAGEPPLTEYAPYAAHVLMVQLFFEMAVASKLISNERPSNRVDIAYLFYLPFCMMFVSSDRLHARCTPLFLRGDQEFVWGLDLKANLREINGHYQRLPEDIKREGLFAFALDPPQVGSGLVGRLWDRFMPTWREKDAAGDETDLKARPSVEEIRVMVDSPSLPAHEIDYDLATPDSVVIERRVRRKKGAWFQVPDTAQTREGRQA